MNNNKNYHKYCPKKAATATTTEKQKTNYRDDDDEQIKHASMFEMIVRIRFFSQHHRVLLLFFAGNFGHLVLRKCRNDCLFDSLSNRFECAKSPDACSIRKWFLVVCAYGNWPGTMRNMCLFAMGRHSLNYSPFKFITQQSYAAAACKINLRCSFRWLSVERPSRLGWILLGARERCAHMLSGHVLFCLLKEREKKHIKYRICGKFSSFFPFSAMNERLYFTSVFMCFHFIISLNKHTVRGCCCCCYCYY